MNIYCGWKIKQINWYEIGVKIMICVQKFREGGNLRKPREIAVFLGCILTCIYIEYLWKFAMVRSCDSWNREVRRITITLIRILIATVYKKILEIPSEFVWLSREQRDERARYFWERETGVQSLFANESRFSSYP